MSNQILFLGPRIGKQNKLGGIVVLFEEIILYAKKNNIKYLVIDTNLDNYSNKFIGLINVLLAFFLKFNKAKHISLHGTARDFIFLAPIIVFVSKIFKKTTSLRKFAGSFYNIYLKSNFLKKGIIKYIFNNSDYLFFETKFLVEKFNSFNSNIFWWPNSRPKTNLLVSENYNKKFVFISQVKKSKGICEFIDAALSIDNSFIFDIYGPILDDIDLNFPHDSNVNYRGIVDPSEVVNTLMKYDVLILPTYHDGEGYPGIILEAFSIGMPVISTKWNSIPEIVNHRVNGLLVPIKDVESLKNAIFYFHQNRFKKLRKNAIKSFHQFDSKLVNTYFFKRINLIDNA